MQFAKNFKNINGVIITSILLSSLSFLTVQPDLQAKTEFKEALKKFTENLNVEMENYLKSTLKRNKVGFTISTKSEGNSAVLTVPSYIERETVFSLKINTDNNQENITVSGNVLTEKQREIINIISEKNFKDYKIINNISVFPYKNIGDAYAVISKSYSDLFVNPGDKELATQALLGTPLRILEISADKQFARVQSLDDKYISWISRKNIIEMNETKWNTWKNSRNTLVVNEINYPVKLYFGTILPGKNINSGNKIEVMLPTGKTLPINKSGVENLTKIKRSISELIKTSDNFLKFGQMGKTTYLWGGTVGKDLDCSGFNQTVFRAEGIFLPRDADQQQNFSRPVAKDLKNINQLKPGDLLFFSENRQYATHTGIYIGNNKFIHSSSGGNYRGVKINTLNGGGVYDKKLQKMYFGGGRVDFDLTHPLSFSFEKRRRFI